jgi:hypothetical protein
MIRKTNYELMLERRINRLENMIKNEAREEGHMVYGKDAAHTMEQNHDIRGAKATANVFADKFTQLTGIKLRRDDSHPIIYSPEYGWTDSLEDLDDDIYSYFVFKYDVVGDNNVSAYICPTLSGKKVGLWSSLGTGSRGEGAVNPETGECVWEDDIFETLYDVYDWENFSLDMIHDEGFDESVRRPYRKTLETKSRKRFRR